MKGCPSPSDTEVLKTNRPELLAEAGADAEALCRKFCGSKETAALPASPHIEHIFSEVYDLPEQLKIPFLKLKCQELLIFLTITEASLREDTGSSLF